MLISILMSRNVSVLSAEAYFISIHYKLNLKPKGIQKSFQKCVFLMERPYLLVISLTKYVQYIKKQKWFCRSWTPCMLLYFVFFCRMICYETVVQSRTLTVCLLFLQPAWGSVNPSPTDLCNNNSKKQGCASPSLNPFTSTLIVHHYLIQLM